MVDAPIFRVDVTIIQYWKKQLSQKEFAALEAFAFITLLSDSEERFR